MHNAIARRILENYDYHHNDFLLGNLLPDADDGTDDNHAYTHFREKIDGKYERFPNIEKFRGKYQNHFGNSLVVGYYCHLLSDTVWRKLRFEKLRNVDTNSYRKAMDSDLVKLNRVLVEHYSLLPYDKLTIPNSIIISEIDKQQIPKLLSNYACQIENVTDGELAIFTLDVVIDYIDTTIKNFIETLYI